MDIGWKIASGIAVAVSGIAANAIVDNGWKLVTGHKPPKGDQEATEQLLEVAIFGVLSGLVVTVMRRYAMRGAAKWYGGSEKAPLD